MHGGFARARACQWKAKPRISTTKPVVAKSVTVSVVSERHHRAHRHAAAIPRSDLASCQACAAQAGRPCRPSASISDTPAEDRDGRDGRIAADCLAELAANGPVGRRAAVAMIVLLASVSSTTRSDPWSRAASGALEGADVRPVGSPASFSARRSKRSGQDRRRWSISSADLKTAWRRWSDLHDGADADGHQKRDDQRRNGAAQRGLGGEQPPIRRVGDRLRQPLDRIRTRGRTRRFRRAPSIGLRSECPRSPSTRKGCAASLPNHVPI